MLHKRLAGALAILALTTGYSAPASSQLVLSCYTLHNDLVNFDRRARGARPYFMQDSEPAHESFETIGPRQKLDKAYLLSHLGGSDPVRLRIIREMQKLDCPLPGHVVRLLSLLEEQDEND